MTAPARNAQGTPLRRAAPAGGARKRGRGCAHSASLAALVLLTGLGMARAQSVFAEPVPMASGLEVVFHDVIRDIAGDGLTYRFRFVVPAIGQGLDFLDVVEDMERLCSEFALARVPQPGPKPARIVVSLMSEPTEFGVANPDVVQFFESYSIENDLCMWEVF